MTPTVGNAERGGPTPEDGVDRRPDLRKRSRARLWASATSTFLLAGAVLALVSLRSGRSGDEPPGISTATRPGLRSPLADDAAGLLVCRIDLEAASIALRLNDEAGRPFGSAQRLGAAMAAGGQHLLLAMNGGMYHEDRSPVGLYVEDGTERHGATTDEGFGNFFMKPNGVFWIAGRRAGIEETGAFLASGRRVDEATQSGPMLVIDGALHPRFIEGSDSRNTRNGVCVLGEGRTVVLAIATRAVNFIDFARIFRDALGCRNALYLDGSVSSLTVPTEGIDIVGEPHLGPLIAVTARPDDTPDTAPRNP